MNQLAELLSSRGRAEIFRLLFGPARGELHVRELERRTGLSDATVRQELKKLSRLGVVEARRDGNRTYYRANGAHPLYPDIRNLVLKTIGLTDVLREALGGVEDIELAFVFGSVAGDNARAHSDIDLMVVGTIGLRQLSKRLSGLEAKLGREVNPHVLTPEEFARRANEGDHFITTVLKGPQLFVVGARMSLEDWASNGWLRRHETSRQEIADLLAIVDRDLADAGANISPDWRFGIAYNAALKLCTILLHASGYRPEKTL